MDDDFFQCCECDWQDDTPPHHRPPFLSELAETNAGAARIRFALALVDELAPTLDTDPIEGGDALFFEAIGWWSTDKKLIDMARAAGVEER